MTAKLSCQYSPTAALHRILSVFGRGEPFLLMEDPAEIQRIFIAYDTPDLGHRIGSCFQQNLCLCDTDGKDVLHGCKPGVFLKIPDEPADAHPTGFGVFPDADLGIVMVVKVLGRLVHFILKIFIFQDALLRHLPVDQNQEVTEQKRQHFFIVGPAALEFGDHSLEDPFIFQGSSGIDYAHVIPDAVASQNIRHVAASEMDPVHLGSVRGIIFIFLKFFWTVDHHISGSHNGFIFLMVKVEMHGSGGNIENLKVQPPAGTVGGQPGMRQKAVSPAAPDDQRSALVFKIQMRIV